MTETAKRGRGRPAGFRMDDSHRIKIQNSNVLNALIEHTEGRRPMSASQVTAGIALLKKVLPDLAAVEISGQGDNGEIIHRVERVIVRAHAADAADQDG